MKLFDRHNTRRRRGQALVEFALIIPLFLLLLVGIFDLGRAVFAYNTLTNAAREGARIAIVNQYEPSIIKKAKDQTAIVELNDPSVAIDFYQVKSDGTPDTSKPVRPRRRRLPGRRVLRGHVFPDHPIRQQHPVQERRDVRGDLRVVGRVQLPADPD